MSVQTTFLWKVSERELIINLLFDNMASQVEGTGKSFLIVCSEDHLPSVPSPDDWYMRF